MSTLSLDAAPDDVVRDVSLAVDAHRRLLSHLDRLVAADVLDVTVPSRLPGWTVGHVITHVTHSGDGHSRMFDAAAAGRVGEQYPGGIDVRNADIDAGAPRPAAEQVDDLRASITRLEQRWASSSWTGRGAAAFGEVDVCHLPFLRVREVAIHHIDLGVGVEFHDLPAEYLRLELRRMEMLWRARQPMGLTPLPDAALAAAPPDRLAWLMGRADIEGLEPARIF